MVFKLWVVPRQKTTADNLALVKVLEGTLLRGTSHMDKC